jgi:hypothetical protein
MNHGQDTKHNPWYRKTRWYRFHRQRTKQFSTKVRNPLDRKYRFFLVKIIHPSEILIGIVKIETLSLRSFHENPSEMNNFSYFLCCKSLYARQLPIANQWSLLSFFFPFRVSSLPFRISRKRFSMQFFFDNHNILHHSQHGMLDSGRLSEWM